MSLNLVSVRKALAPLGLTVEERDDGALVLVDAALEALSGQMTHTFYIRCRHEVNILYQVEGTDFEDALSKLCDVELFQDRGDDTFGPCPVVMEEGGIEVIDADCFSDPAPTGKSSLERNWEWECADEMEET